MEESLTVTTDRKWYEVSGSFLKWIAIILMMFNHFVYDLYKILGINNYFTTDVHWFLTRGAFVIFAFFIAEGMHYTHDRKRYIFSLFAFAIVSEIPYDLFMADKVYSFANQNVFFTLAIGALVIVAIDYFKKKPVFQIFAVLIGCVIATYLKTDYSFLGVATIASFYAFREKRWKQLLITGVVFTIATILLYMHDYYSMQPDWELFTYYLKSYKYFWRPVIQELHGLTIFPVLALYRGRKGKNINKWFFYGFYPGHLLLIWGILKIISVCIK